MQKGLGAVVSLRGREQVGKQGAAGVRQRAGERAMAEVSTQTRTQRHNCHSRAAIRPTHCTYSINTDSHTNRTKQPLQWLKSQSTAVKRLPQETLINI